MRKTFIETLCELAQSDSRIVLLTADLGYTVLEPFLERFRDRFFNLGVCEQNAVSVATGLAESGFIPFIYTMVPFAVLRPLEFLRNGPCYHRLPVRVIGVGAGLDYSRNGLTHFGIEDIGVLRTLPTSRIIAPVDSAQTKSALVATYGLPEPIYYRISKDEVPAFSPLNGAFKLDDIQWLVNGSSVVIFSLGRETEIALKVCSQLRSQQIDVGLVVLSSLHPAPCEGIRSALASARLAVTIEAHALSGGIGSIVCEAVAEQALGCKVLRFGVSDVDGKLGSLDYLYQKFGLTVEQIVPRVIRELQ